MHICLPTLQILSLYLPTTTRPYLLLWTPAQRSLSEVHVIFCECFFFHIFYGRLMLRPRLTEVHETIDVVDLECE